MKTTVLNPFIIDPDSHAIAHGISFDDPSLTVQADVQQSDINYIVKQYGLTQSLPYGEAVPVYADYSDIPNDYHAALNYIKDSEEAFLTMPAESRSRFKNDPGLFLDFVSDPANYDEAADLGFVPPKPIPTDGLPIPPVPPVVPEA